MLHWSTLTRRVVMTAALLIATGPFAAANLVTNGGFETGNFNGWHLLGLGNPTCDINVVQYNGIYTCNDQFQYQEPDMAYQGTYFAAFPNAFPTESAYQDLSTQAGHTYKLSFAYSVDTFGFGDCAFTDCWLDVRWGGQQVFFTTKATDGWTFVTLDGLAATGDSTQLLFTGFSNPGQIVFDDVSVEDEVPEPASLGLAASAMALAIGRLRSGLRREP